ncbi:MAG: hypothetical protein Q8O55_08905 [Dehalococcoidales bacterium]|nr:hypothetical protein [Dehalococcoidales bacterium]
MLDKLAQGLTDEATKVVVGHKIISIKFNILFREKKPGLYQAAFTLVLDNGTVIDCNAWLPSIEAMT